MFCYRSIGFFEYRVNCISIIYTVKERKVCDNFYKKICKLCIYSTIAFITFYENIVNAHTMCPKP